MKLPKLTVPTMGLIDNPEPLVYTSHCDNIAHFLANTVFMWNARRKIRRYLELTGASTQ